MERLKEAREKYESAVQTFENTNFFIATKIGDSEIKSVRDIFINGLDDLKNATDAFLAQPNNIIKLD